MLGVAKGIGVVAGLAAVERLGVAKGLGVVKELGIIKGLDAVKLLAKCKGIVSRAAFYYFSKELNNLSKTLPDEA